ncbi:hypothetical protein CYMTET_30914 [Cymbomonas tetramitiformis]|uniref:Uncharacterized protein n=1 Tax=Cymbomonas tetramitiformis TaxID=36881 RepID=A0AAE0FI98_9CHLO|nr:hypothetical protein CYMTET_30914 [Cymbomonas tetramitiformis]
MGGLDRKSPLGFSGLRPRAAEDSKRNSVPASTPKSGRLDGNWEGELNPFKSLAPFSSASTSWEKGSGAPPASKERQRSCPHVFEGSLLVGVSAYSEHQSASAPPKPEVKVRSARHKASRIGKKKLHVVSTTLEPPQLAVDTSWSFAKNSYGSAQSSPNLSPRRPTSVHIRGSMSAGRVHGQREEASEARGSRTSASPEQEGDTLSRAHAPDTSALAAARAPSRPSTELSPVKEVNVGRTISMSTPCTPAHASTAQPMRAGTTERLLRGWGIKQRDPVRADPAEDKPEKGPNRTRRK